VPKLISTIMDIGDLSTLYGLEEFDCTGLNFEEGKISEAALTSLQKLNDENIKPLLDKGVLFIRINDALGVKRFVDLPVNVIRDSSKFYPKTEINSPANFNLYQDDRIVKHVINGWLCNPGETDRVKNGLIF